MAVTPGAYRQWKVTDALLHDAEETDWPFFRRMRRAATQVDKLRINRLELIAIDAALGETRDALSQRNEPSLLAMLDEVERDVEQQSEALSAGSPIELPWAHIDDVRRRAGLEPAIKPRKLQ